MLGSKGSVPDKVEATVLYGLASEIPCDTSAACPTDPYVQEKGTRPHLFKSLWGWRRSGDCGHAPSLIATFVSFFCKPGPLCAQILPCPTTTLPRLTEFPHPKAHSLRLWGGVALVSPAPLLAHVATYWPLLSRVFCCLAENSVKLSVAEIAPASLSDDYSHELQPRFAPEDQVLLPTCQVHWFPTSPPPFTLSAAPTRLLPFPA